MNAISKMTLSAGLALALTTFGAPQARAGGWWIPGAVVGGVAAGAVIGATVAAATAPPYAYAPPAYPAYGYAPYGYAPSATVVVGSPAYYPRYYAPYPYVYGWGRGWYGWGRSRSLRLGASRLLSLPAVRASECGGRRGYASSAALGAVSNDGAGFNK